jgi:hypothetical protein
MELGGLHPITGRQWKVTDEQSNSLWPDACIVVPFGRQVADGTGKIVNPAPGVSVDGGWTVQSTLETLQLYDVVQDAPVAGVTAVWAAGPGGDTPALHVLGNDPFSWLTPHLDAPASAQTTAYPTLDQWFGTGPAQAFSKPRRFGRVVISPSPLAMLLTPPLGWIAGRALRAPSGKLSFSYPSGLPIVVDRLWLGVLRGVEEPMEPGLQYEELLGLPDGWSVGLIPLWVGGGSDSVEVPYGGSILFVRYHQMELTVTAPERITLQPGHYEMTLSGKTTGKAPSNDLQDATDVLWSAKQRFWVAHPPSLRPYVRSTTLGDDRLFGPKPGFDPTLPGVGFPAHGDYLPVVRFCVPYVDAMFAGLRMRLDSPDPSVTDVVQDVSVVANPAGDSTLPAAAQVWKTAHGGAVPPDDEIVMTAPLPPGPAALHVSHVPPAGAEFELDSWGVHVSRFPNAAAHLAWPGTCLTRCYRPDGPHDQAACPTIASPKWKDVYEAAIAFRVGAHEPRPIKRRVRPAAAKRVLFSDSVSGKLLRPVGPYINPMPDEYATPPGDWPLPGNLASLCGDLDPGAAQRFLQFLWRSGVRLSSVATHPRLAGVGRPASTTTIEAVCDAQNRPLALWLRTPEAIDWRRIHAEMTLRHVTPATGCPTGYEHRHTMTLGVCRLPSTDGSGALLVARLADIPTRLPRGEVALRLTYEPAAPPLVTLRPRTALPGGNEILDMTFLQPFGATWPIKPPDDGIEGKLKIPKVYKKRKFGPPEPLPYGEKASLEDLVSWLSTETRARR